MFSKIDLSLGYHQFSIRLLTSLRLHSGPVMDNPVKIDAFCD